jgi:hypothetical protein
MQRDRVPVSSQVLCSQFDAEAVKQVPTMVEEGGV